MIPAAHSLPHARRISLFWRESYNPTIHSSNPLSTAIAGLYSSDAAARLAAATQIFYRGRSAADAAISAWWQIPALRLLLGSEPLVTVGLAVHRDTFERIHTANGAPTLALIPPDQDADEFELHFPGQISLDILTTREPQGPGAIASFLLKFGENIQQVEFLCSNVDRATELLRTTLGINPVYPETRPGADGSRINFFLIPTGNAGKILIELYERA
jgi:hypothetical protein